MDRGKVVTEVLDDYDRWLRGFKLVASGSDTSEVKSFAFVTCGDWDLKTMLPHQLSLIKRYFSIYIYIYIMNNTYTLVHVH